MSYARQMLDSHRRTSGLDVGVLAATIDALTGLRPVPPTSTLTSVSSGRC